MNFVWRRPMLSGSSQFKIRDRQAEIDPMEPPPRRTLPPRAPPARRLPRLAPWLVSASPGGWAGVVTRYPVVCLPHQTAPPRFLDGDIGYLERAWNSAVISGSRSIFIESTSPAIEASPLTI